MKESRTGLYMLLALTGIFFLLSVLVLNPFVLGVFKSISSDPNYRSDRAWILSFLLIIQGICFLLLGYMGYKKKWKSPSKIISGFLWFGLLPFLLLFNIEMLLRVKPIQCYTEVLDMSVPYVPSPLARHMFPAEDQEVLHPNGTTKYQIRNGYHGPAIPIEKPEGEIRMVFLGGSFVFGDHEPWTKDLPEDYAHNWVQRIEEKLHANGFPNVRILNAGTPGHASYDSFGRYLMEIHWYQPDFVFVCHGWNDIKYFRDIQPEHPLLRTSPTLDKETHEYPEGMALWMEQFQLGRRINQFQRRENRKRGTEGLIQEMENLSDYSPFAEKQYSLNIQALTQVIKQSGATPVLLSQPRLVKPEMPDSLRKRIRYDYQGLDHAALCKAYAATDSIMETIALESEARYLDFASMVDGNPEYFVDHVHLSARGNEALSKMLASYIQDSLITLPSDE